ncbi:MAG TPA: cupin domain-containing protein [Candidatus Limnocylindrales bacterium]|nr:cupin domain-containing protein [Candidatus Limnocylindrales bacterium]
MDIRRFGPGHRRPEGPPGSTGLTGQVIHDDARAVIAELAFGPNAMIAPHTNPNTTFFIVVSGGGFVQVGEERSRVIHGEAVLWPPDIVHGAYTEGTEMRAIVVELSGTNDAWARGLLAAHAMELPSPAAVEADRPTPTPADGSLTSPKLGPAEHDPSSGEPW